MSSFPLECDKSSLANSKFGYVYRTTNTVNGKTYVGMKFTSNDRQNLWEDYLGSGKVLLQAIEKYGKASFQKELLFVASSKEELLIKEHEIILEEWASGKGEYNLVSYTPDPTSWVAFPEAEKQQLNRKRGESIASAHKKKGPTKHSSHLRALKNVEELLSRLSIETLIKKYNELGSMQKTAIFYGESYKVLRRAMEMAGVTVTPRTIPGWKHSEETKTAISKTLKQRNFNNTNVVKEGK